MMLRRITVMLIAFALLRTCVLGQGSVYKKYDKWFHYSQTKVTPERIPHLTCIDGDGTDYVIGSRGSGLFRFTPATRTFETYPRSEVFSDKQITAVAVGAGRDEVFVGTYFSGLFRRRRDGSWETFGESNGLPGGRITSLVSNGSTVWIGTDQGLARYEQGRLMGTTVARKVESIAVDRRSGRIYVGHAQSHISVFDPKRRQWSTVKMAVEPPVTFKHLLVEPTGDILVGTFLGLFRISGQSGRVTDLTKENEKKLISCLYASDDGKVYVGIFGKNKGLHLLRDNTLTSLFRAYSGFSETVAYRRSRRGDNCIISFGRLWHFTDRFVRDGTLKEVQYLVDQASSTGRSLTDPIPSVGSRPGPGLDNLPQPPGQERRVGGIGNLPPPPTGTGRSTGLPAPPASLPAPPSSGQPVSTARAVPPRAASSAATTTVVENESVIALAPSVGRLWIGTQSGQLLLLTGEDKVRQARKFDGPVSILFYSNTGRLYIVAEGRTIYTFNGFSYRQFISASDEITALADGPQGGLWVGTRSGLYRSEGTKLTAVPRIDALPDRYIAAVLAEGNQLWVGTRLGLARLVGTNWKVFTVADGLPSQDVRSLATFGGALWVGTPLGVATGGARGFQRVSPRATTALKVVGSQLWSANENSLVKRIGRDWSNPVASPLGRIQAVEVVGTKLAIATDRGLFLLAREAVQ